MELDFRNDDEAPEELKTVNVMTINTLWTYCQKRAINPLSIEVIHFGPGDAPLDTKVGWAAAIAKKFVAVVHFEHKNVPITAYPDTQSAARADFERRRAAGERVYVEQEE